jgi:hypothetical protein
LVLWLTFAGLAIGMVCGVAIRFVFSKVSRTV